tara:strand:+ start:1272 stop:2378 length:1107 start_codon:yes stop_codon:yes gene_type:complete
MVLLITCEKYNLYSNNLDDNHSFIVLNENNMSFKKIPYIDELNSKNKYIYGRINKQRIVSYDGGRTSFRPYGVTHDENNIYIASNELICSFDINTFVFKKIITDTGRVNTHQILYNDGYIYRCDTAVNCITKINVNTSEEIYFDIVQQKVIDKLYECSHCNDKGFYHINNIFIVGNKLHINAQKYINLLSDDKKDDLIFYNKIMNFTNDEYNNYVKNKYPSYQEYYFNIFENILQDIDINDFQHSRSIILNLDTNTFESNPIKIYGTGHHGMLIIDDNFWSIDSYSGKLIKKNKNETSEYKLVNENEYKLRGLTYKEDSLYILAFPLSVFDDIYTIPSLMLIFNINTQEITSKDLPKEICITNDVDYI